MCGLAGIMTGDGSRPDDGVLDRLEQALRHRGPDGTGRHVSASVGIVHTRLAIIDLETGDQPLLAKDGQSFANNGEIYNYLEIREMLGSETFVTSSDTEAGLRLYLRDGDSFADGLRGMYAIAVHDPTEENLLLARDPFGIKPLYYVEGAHGLAFASEPQALIASGLVGPEINDGAREELLNLQFTTGRETIFAGIQRILPGETLTVSAGRIVGRYERRVLPPDPPLDIDETQALQRFEDVMLESVSFHQRSDVPYGMFLSGGIDSALLLAMMARLNESPVTALTAGFTDTKVHDERELARELAARTGANHIEVEFSEQDFWQLLPEVAAALDDPAADYATLPTFKLAALAKQEGLKVVLSGEGGDELFAGYGRYRDAVRPWWTGGPRAMRRHGRFEGLGVLRRQMPGWRDGIRAAESRAKRRHTSPLQQAQAIDCSDWLPNDLLIKLDRCLMAHGVEGRTPFLDPAVAEFAFRLPDELKVQNRLGKYLPRSWLATHLPAAKPFSRKRGFTVPVAEWISARGDKLGPLVAAQPGIAEIADSQRVVDLFRRSGKKEGFAAWTLLFYALWHRRHLLGKMPEGDVFDTLAAKI
jgi:asparagine synthase (glutamine-hydrolysing)